MTFPEGSLLKNWKVYLFSLYLAKKVWNCCSKFELKCGFFGFQPRWAVDTRCSWQIYLSFRWDRNLLSQIWPTLSSLLSQKDSVLSPLFYFIFFTTLIIIAVILLGVNRPLMYIKNRKVYGWIIHNKIYKMHLQNRQGEFSFHANFNDCSISKS